MDDIHLKINDMLIYIINYVHQDLVLLGMFITDPERYLCCYYNEDNEDYDYDEDYYEDDGEDDDYEEEAEEGDEDCDEEEEDYYNAKDLPPAERARRLFARNLLIDQHFMYSISMFGTLNKVEWGLIKEVIDGLNKMEHFWDTEDADLFDSTWKNLWSTWENFVNNFHKEYGYTVIFPN